MNEFELQQKNTAFINQTKQKNPQFFDELKKGQTPEFFVLACCDSRVTPSTITQMPLGQMFIHRNIANQVVLEDDSFTASLYFALNHLKVKKIIIKGHTDCGGIKAAQQNNNDHALERWIKHIKKCLPDESNKEQYNLEDLAKINVIKQVEHIKQHPIYKAYGADVHVSGYLFHVESGELKKVI